ncbi:citrate synthase [Gregarina niphandrodes]|uniref:Citrate synthase n=1 Tax=Gregarina niphandrodes TaxID=110365 RepID=A0A023B7I4_GRENI|nr:citrate synthase [Gregarina niphandrodes]EZG67406.1 citrate synthase [Gregarina niphandrodes]|eukprot:XP_011130239.1 citrate synthase [Gregarina niphandrodes]
MQYHPLQSPTDGMAVNGPIEPFVKMHRSPSRCHEQFKKLDESTESEESYATLTLKDGRTIKLRHLAPTAGSDIVLDVRSLYNDEQVCLYDPGFNSVASCASAITFVDGALGKCHYRGYDVSSLVKRHDFLDVAYLLLNGELPDTAERRMFEDVLKSEMLVHNRIKEFITTFVPGAHPMSILSSVLSAMASFYADPMDQRYMQDRAMRELACVRLLAKIPTVVAMAYKVLIGEPMVYPRADLSYAENFLYMMFATPTSPFVVNELHAQVIDTFLSIHADHEQNASTSTIRTAGSSLANPYACIATGVTSLWGRAHGGANEAVVDMLTDIGSVQKVPEFIKKVKEKKCRLMGFGHRVYKNTDPRAFVMQDLCHKVFAQMNAPDPLFQIAKALETVALNDEYFVSRKLYPNVDFYSGIVMRALHIPKEMFTVLFAMGRCVGWLSHWKEMVEERQIKITRPRQLYVGEAPRLLPGEKREKNKASEPSTDDKKSS